MNQQLPQKLNQTGLDSSPKLLVLELQEKKQDLLSQIDQYKEKLGKNFKLRLRLGKNRRDELNYHIQLLRKDIKRIDTKLVLLNQSIS